MNLFNAVLNFIFPQTCGICEKICEDAICSSCKKKLEKITFPHRKCFLEITGIYYDEHMHIFKYEGIIKEKLRQYKFKDQAYLCEFFAEIIYSNKKIMKYINNYDYIIPVPLHKYRSRERGYNQSFLICRQGSARKCACQGHYRSMIHKEGQTLSASGGQHAEQYLSGGRCGADSKPRDYRG